MSPWPSDVPAPGLCLLATIATIAREDADTLKTQGCQTQYMSNDSVVGGSSTKDGKIGDFSIKATSASETGIAAAEKEKRQFNRCREAFQPSMNLEQRIGNVHVTKPGKKHQDCENTSKSEKSLGRHSKNKHGGHDRNKYQCEQCGREFSFNSSLKRHKKTVHTAILREQCPDCKKMFKNKRFLNKHKKYEHAGYDGNGYRCEQCGRVFSFYTSLKRHKGSVHATVPREQCPDCKKMFKSKRLLNEHRKYEHADYDEDRFQCEQCGRVFSYYNSLNRHKGIVHKIAPPEQCPDCKKMFKNKKYLTAHRKYVHGAQKQYRCDKCNSLFRSFGDLKRHIMDVHLMKSRWMCCDCKKMFEKKEYLLEHKRNKHGGCNKTYSYAQCSRQFQRSSNLQQPIETVYVAESEQRRKCSHCTQTFKDKASLYVHTIKMHAEHEKHDKQYERDQCNQTFALPFTSSQGSLAHMSERIHKCFYCHVTCESASMLARHALKEHATRREIFACEVCGRCFPYSSSLIRHMLVHSGMKLFDCQICNKKFVNKSSLTKHQKIHVII